MSLEELLTQYDTILTYGGHRHLIWNGANYVYWAGGLSENEEGNPTRIFYNSDGLDDALEMLLGRVAA